MTTESRAILERNMASLRRAQPDLDLSEAPATARLTQEAWRLVPADGGAPVAIHGRDPQREADRAADQLLSDRAPDVVVAIGFSLGYLGDALERRGWTGKLLAIEPATETVVPLLERRDWTTWIERDRLRILVAPEYRGAGDCWRWFGEGPSDPGVIVHPVLERIRPVEVAAARGVLRRIQFDAVSNAEARRAQGARYLLNTLRNLPAIASEADVAALRGAARQRAAVIVAAGPSLDSALAAVHEVQDRALIIAVDTALRPLLAAGVRPHAVVAVDPSEANARHLTDLPSCDQTFLIAEGSIDPFALAPFAGRRFFFSVSDHHPWPWLRSLQVDAGRLRAWGSVLTSAFDLAVNVEANPVIFIGADLSYPGDRPYCRGVSFEEDWHRAERWGTPIADQWRQAIDRWGHVLQPDVSGAPVRTAPHLIAFRDWLLEQIGRERGRRFVNAGGAGILHGRGIEQILPADVRRLLSGHAADVSRIVGQHHRPRHHARLREGTSDLLRQLTTGARPPWLDEWLDFAPGLTPGAIADALGVADRGFRGEEAPTAVVSQPAAPVIIDTEADYIREMASALPLVPLVLPPHRLEATQSGARMYRFRTTSAAIMCCAMRAWKSGMAEDGVPMTRGYNMDQVDPGTYVAARDVVHFRSTDGSDPRTNGRQYAILVPPPVIYLEGLPLADILAHDL